MLAAPPRANNPPLSHLRRQWVESIDNLTSPHFELDAEEFAGLLSIYKLLKREGETFDPMVSALLLVLERQAAETVDGFEDDTDSDEDATDDALAWGAAR